MAVMAEADMAEAVMAVRKYIIYNISDVTSR